MGTSVNLSLRLPPNVSDLRVLNLGAGICGSPISEQIPKIPFGELINVEIWPASFAQLQRIKFAARKVENVCEDVGSYVLKYFEPDIFDVILIIDVLEHFDKTVARVLLNHCKVVSKRVVVFLPIGNCPQGSLEGNPYQRHQSTWTPNDFEGAYIEYLPKFHLHFQPPVDAAWVIYGS